MVTLVPSSVAKMVISGALPVAPMPPHPTATYSLPSEWRGTTLNESAV